MDHYAKKMVVSLVVSLHQVISEVFDYRVKDVDQITIMWVVAYHYVVKNGKLIVAVFILNVRKVSDAKVLV